MQAVGAIFLFGGFEMPTAIADFETAVDNLVTALEAEDFPDAWLKLAVAEARYLKIPVESRQNADAVRYRESMASALEKAQSQKRSGGDGRRMTTTKLGF